MKVSEWVPKYIKKVIADVKRKRIDAEYWNGLWNLVITQGDNNTEGIEACRSGIQECFGAVNESKQAISKCNENITNCNTAINELEKAKHNPITIEEIDAICQ